MHFSTFIPLLLASAASAQSFVRLTPLATIPRDRWDSPITTAVEQPDAPGTFWVGLQGGGLYRVNTTTGAVSPAMMTLPATVGGETGLLGLAFHPDFAENGRFYVYYSNLPEFLNRLCEFTYNPATPDVVPLATERRILDLGRMGFHNGGWIDFGPDGLLYLARGDAGETNYTPQNPATLLGKILRLDVDRDDFPADPARNYGIPAGNPFASGGGAGEIWALGLRNPWRCSFDRATGDLWIGDVGENIVEEINRIPDAVPAMNFGWPCFEGTTRRSIGSFCDAAVVMTPPVLTYPNPSDGSVAVTGGFVYRGGALPRLRGAYLYADHFQRRFWAYENGVSRRVNIHAPAFMINTFGQDARGELYVAGSGRTVYRVDCGADFNGDGFVDFFDIIAFFDCFEGSCAPDHTADANGDEFLDFFDVTTFLDAFEHGC